MENYQNKCFISLIIKALSVKKKFKLYNLEKKSAGSKNPIDNRCLCPKYSKYCNSGFRKKNLEREKNGLFERFFIEDSVENFIVKSAFGFIGGILLTYICFMFLVFSLNFTLKRATYICIGLGIILSLGLAFSVKIRCTVFLCIPQLFSKRGRQALLAYAFILALSGPAKNTLHNVEVMSESLACGQEQLKQAENEVLKCVQKPNAAAKKSVEKLLEKINSAVKYFKNFIFQLYRNCFDILETVLHARKWLYSISFLCQTKIGKPTQRCMNLLAEVIENCKGIKDCDEWNKVCQISLFNREQICSPHVNAFCLDKDVKRSLPILKLQKELMAFKDRATNIYSVKIEACQTYSQYNRTNIYHEEYQGMATEIRQKTDKFLQYFDFMSVIFGIFILVLFVKVIIYRHKFLTEDHYDNRFITSDFVDIDNARAEFQMETLLPLTPREKMKYIKVTSCRLVPCEKVRLLSSFVFLIFATFKIIIHMLTDSSLYWILSSVRQDERLLYMSTIRVDHPSLSLGILGNGLAASLIRNVSTAVKEHWTVTPLDPTPCLPDPVPPDWNRYYQILALVLICWFLALCEPYGLRLRHSVMVTYHPDRARERAIWLYNRIMSNRTCFVKVARKELRKKYKDNPKDIVCSFQFLRIKPSMKCLLCNVKLTSTGKYFKCQTVKCAGVYCGPCFGSLKFCSICTGRGDHKDLSDLSEERDSSDEDFCRCRKPKPVISQQRVPISTSNSFSMKLRKVKLNLRKELETNKLAVGSPQKKSATLIRTKLFFESSKGHSSIWKLQTRLSNYESEISAPKLTPQTSVNTSRNTFPCFWNSLKIRALEEKKERKTVSDVESSDWDAETHCTEARTSHASMKTSFGSKTSSERVKPNFGDKERTEMRQPKQPTELKQSRETKESKKLNEPSKPTERKESKKLTEPNKSTETKEPKKTEVVKSVLKKFKGTNEKDQVAIRLFQKVPTPDGRSREHNKQKRLSWKISDDPPQREKAHLKTKQPYTIHPKILDSKTVDPTKTQPKPNFRFHSNKPSRRKSEDESSRSKSSKQSSSLVKKSKEEEEKEYFSMEPESKKKDKKEVFAGFWFVNNESLLKGFKSISYGLDTSVGDESAPEVSRGSETPAQSVSCGSSSATQHSKIFPFIDPVSICQLDPCPRTNSRRKPNRGKFDVTAALMLQLPPQSSGPSIKNADSSETFTSGQTEICLGKHCSTSGDDDGQYYSQPYFSCESKSASTDNTDLKKTNAKLNLKIKKNTFAKIYSVETDSSNEKFLSVKTNRRGKHFRLKKYWSEEKPSPPLSSSSSTWGGWDQKPSKPTRKPSKSWSEGNDTVTKKPSQLSWAPDLLSDLPSSKPKLSDTSSD